MMPMSIPYEIIVCELCGANHGRVRLDKDGGGTNPSGTRFVWYYWTCRRAKRFIEIMVQIS